MQKEKGKRHYQTPVNSWDIKKHRKIFFLVVGAGSLDVTGLLALVANTLAASLSGAIAGNVADLAA